MIRPSRIYATISFSVWIGILCQLVVEVVEIKGKLQTLKSEINFRKLTYSKEDQSGVFTVNSELNLHTDHITSLLNLSIVFLPSSYSCRIRVIIFEEMN